MIACITFQEPEDVTNPGQDGVQYSFPFTVVDSALIGAPEQASQTKNHRIIVAISRSRLAGWQLSDANVLKVLFEYGKRHVTALFESNVWPKDFTIRYSAITTASHPESVCPFDLTVIAEPAGLSITVERTKPRIGFSA
jgi:hypothetical protein